MSDLKVRRLPLLQATVKVFSAWGALHICSTTLPERDCLKAKEGGPHKMIGASLGMEVLSESTTRLG